jgi:hypothetical protein
MDLVYVSAGFNIINRIAEALKVTVPPTKVFFICGRFLYLFGYRVLAGFFVPFVGAATPSGNVDRFAQSVDHLVRSITRSSSSLDSSIRIGALTGCKLVQPLEDFVRKIWTDGRSVTENDITYLLNAGYSEDQLFELIVAAAVGAGLFRIRIGRRAIGLDRSCTLR